MNPKDILIIAVHYVDHQRSEEEEEDKAVRLR